MPTYRIYRLRENPSQQFRWAPHVVGATQVKRKDYDQAGPVDAANEYAAWSALKEAGNPLRVGDVLEAENGTLRVCKYVGFDAAVWIVPEVRTGLENAPGAAGPADPSEPGLPTDA